MKRTFTIFLLVMLVSVVFMPNSAYSQAYETNQRSKAIHIVYDDSGSMIRSNNVYLDRWGQAKYAMEVFAAMLEERDTMRVYYMSDFDTSVGGNINANPRIVINGSTPATERVSRIHNTVTLSANTPFDPVVKAYNDLTADNADDKWLVVLTDGMFNRLNGEWNYNIDVNGRLFQYASHNDINLILLAIGDDVDLIRLVDSLTPNAGIGYFVDHARNTAEILGKITSICNRIFNRNSLRFGNEARREFNFDLPMIELLVFAQGEEVRINGIRGGGSFNPSGTVNVRYSDVAATNYVNDRNVIISRDLTGVIASFQNIPKGSYSLDVSGAQTVEIYYKPDVNLRIKLFKGNREVRRQDIEEGDYQIRFGIINEKGEFFESELLGNVTYTATVRNDGREFRITNGEIVSLSPGDFIVEVKAQFLDINTSESVHNLKVTRKLTSWERFIEWAIKYWWILAILVLALLWFLCYRVFKKRFHEDMARQPRISKRIGSNPKEDGYGLFEIDFWSWFLPLIPQTGKLTVLSDFDNSLPQLEVKALGGDYMKLININLFIRKALGERVFKIDGNRIPNEYEEEDKKMHCLGETTAVFFNNGVKTEYVCRLSEFDDI